MIISWPVVSIPTYIIHRSQYYDEKTYRQDFFLDRNGTGHFFYPGLSLVLDVHLHVVICKQISRYIRIIHCRGVSIVTKINNFIPNGFAGTPDEGFPVCMLTYSSPGFGSVMTRMNFLLSSGAAQVTVKRPRSNNSKQFQCIVFICTASLKKKYIIY